MELQHVEFSGKDVNCTNYGVVMKLAEKSHKSERGEFNLFNEIKLFVGYLYDLISHVTEETCTDSVESILLSIERLYSWTATVVSFMTEKDKRGGHRKKSYFERYRAILKLAV